MEKLSPEQITAMSDTEKHMENMIKDTMIRLTNSCSSKCIKDRTYRNPEVVKEEAVCIDRCVAKYLAFSDIIGKRITKDKATFDLLANPPYIEKTPEV